jgi:hypothetical protein
MDQTLYSLSSLAAHVSTCDASIGLLETAAGNDGLVNRLGFHHFCHVAGDREFCGEDCSRPVLDEKIYDTIVSTKPTKRRN